MEKGYINMLETELREIVDEFTPKIGGLGEEGYNEELDNICCRLLDLKEKINWM